MDIRFYGRKGSYLCAGIAMALMSSLGFAGGAAGANAAEGPQPPSEQNVVLSGSYTCSYNITTYSVGAIGDPEPTTETFAETTDSLYMSTTGGNVAASGPGLGTIQSPIGLGPGVSRPLVGGTQTTTPVSGFSTGHSFNGGSIEDCVRFVQTVSIVARGLGCTTSDVRRRQPPTTLGFSNASATFSFICEGPESNIIHGMGELSRAVLALKLLPVP